MLDLVPDAAVLVAAEEEIAPALRRPLAGRHAPPSTTTTRTTSTSRPDGDRDGARRARKVRLSAIDQDQPTSSAARRPTSPRAASRTPSRSWRSSCAPATAPSSRSARRGEGERAAYNLGRLKVRWVDGGAPAGADLAFAEARLRDGFIAPGFRLAVIPEHRLFRRRPQRAASARRGRRRRGALRSFTDLRTGDIVVHEDHGLARFAGFDTKTVAGVTRDYLELEYAGTDKVFLPVDQFAKISRYVGAGGEHPPLSKLGGTRWDTTQGPRPQSRAGAGRRAAQPLRRAQAPRGPRVPARHRLAARLRGRLALPRDARPARGDRAGQGRHGDAAPDGPARSAATSATARRRSRCAPPSRPRNDGKQVMVLVPTTILAQQHYGTFSERLKDYPFTIEHVSRFRPAAEQRAAIAGSARARSTS